MPPGLFNKLTFDKMYKHSSNILMLVQNDELMDYNCGILMIKEITLIEKSIQLGQKNDVNYACTKNLLIVECK